MPNRADPAPEAPFAVLTIVYSDMWVLPKAAVPGIQDTECGRLRRVAISVREPLLPTKMS
jgi:hypothetical protein